MRSDVLRAARSGDRRLSRCILPGGVLAALLVVAACGPVAETDAAPGRAIETARLDDGEAIRIAREIREEVDEMVEVAEGFQLQLWAPESLLIDPHAIAVGYDGAVYTASSGRTRTQRAVNMRFRDDLANTLKHRSVEDLRAYLRAHLTPDSSEANREWLPDLNSDRSHDWRDLTVENERVYRLRDTSGDGRADLSQLIVEDFGSEVTDIAGGVAVHGSDVYVGAAPGVWRLRDRTGDGIPDEQETVSEGYGVRLGFFAHGMSGITVGPDGRLYWSIGDVGLNVVDNEGRRWELPNQGAILRANPDGSDFEVFAAGVRNVWEFAFDEHGNLIGADNDGDQPGEQERLVYLVKGSDSGWRTNWQYGKYSDERNNPYRVWMEEGLHLPDAPGQPAHITPAVSLFVNGPAGMAYNPGTALSERWRDHFFVADARGSTSSIHAFTVEEDGAGFRLVSDTVLLDGGLMTTSVDFGPDGKLYLSDLVTKIKPELGGRIWTLDDTTGASWPLREEARELLAASFEQKPSSELQTLLGHTDMRVRMKAQFELVDRSDVSALAVVAERPDPTLARLHAVWGIGQLARAEADRARVLLPLLRDEDAEVRAQAAKAIGEAGYQPAGSALVPLLRDGSARVRFFAAQALGDLRHEAATQPLIAMLAANGGNDAYLRHAGVLALAQIGSSDPLVALSNHPSKAVRIAGVVALRRMRHPGVAAFLHDADEAVVTEAARAINDDGGIPAALSSLAGLLDETRFTGEPLLRRIINANLRLGTTESLRRVGAYAARNDAPTGMRVEALSGLGSWADPSEFDRVDGMYRGPIADREVALAHAAMADCLPFAVSPDAAAEVRAAAAEAAGRLGLRSAEPVLLELLRHDPALEVRLAALTALERLPATDLAEVVQSGLRDSNESVRGRALEMTMSLGLPEGTTAALLSTVIADGSIAERQAAISALGTLEGAEAAAELGRLLKRFRDGSLEPEVQLDVLEAVQGSAFPGLRGELERYLSARTSGDPVEDYAEALHGGDALSGRQIVRRHEGAQCTRCHSVGEAGSTVGPDLRGVGARLDRRQLLQALVDPNARIAPGYGEQGAPSAMPPMGGILSRREIRDVVEYLSSM